MADTDLDTPPGQLRAAGVSAAPGASALPAVVTPAADLSLGTPAAAVRAAGALLQTITTIARDTDLISTRVHGHRPQTGAPSGEQPAAGDNVPGTTPLTSVAPSAPATGGAAPPAPHSGLLQHGATGLSLPSAYPNVQLIPPASLPAPAEIVPAPAGISVGPIVGLAASVLMLAALVGLRIARRTG